MRSIYMDVSTQTGTLPPDKNGELPLYSMSFCSYKTPNEPYQEVEKADAIDM
jgi:hypothetical protein